MESEVSNVSLSNTALATWLTINVIAHF
jgi:hypothetical protein